MNGTVEKSIKKIGNKMMRNKIFRKLVLEDVEEEIRNLLIRKYTTGKNDRYNIVIKNSLIFRANIFSIE